MGERSSIEAYALPYKYRYRRVPRTNIFIVYGRNGIIGLFLFLNLHNLSQTTIVPFPRPRKMDTRTGIISRRTVTERPDIRPSPFAPRANYKTRPLAAV